MGTRARGANRLGSETMTEQEFPQTCGGCRGIGAHTRWCPENVGREASRRGRWSEHIESLADSVGANNPVAANHLYAAASLLLNDAKRLRDEHQGRGPSKPIVEGLGQRLQEAMGSSTQMWLAEQVGTNQAAVSYWVNGKRQPELQTLIRLGEVLGVSVAWLAFGIGER